MASARAILAAFVIAVPAGALAQQDSPDAAPSRAALIEDAERAADRGAHPEALALALEAAAIEETPSLVLFIAQQQGLSGRTAEAIGSARRCAREAEARASLRNRRAIRATCRSLERELLRRVGLLTVTVASDREDLRVTINAAALPRDLWGRPQVVEPGEVLIEASAGAATMRQRLRVEAGQESSIELHFASGEIVSRERIAEAPSIASSVSPYWLSVPLGAAAAFVIGAVATGAAALERGGAYASLYDRCAAGEGGACAQAMPVRSDGEALRDATNVLWTAAAFAGAAAVLLALFTDFEDGALLRVEGPWPVARF